MDNITSKYSLDDNSISSSKEEIERFNNKNNKKNNENTHLDINNNKPNIEEDIKEWDIKRISAQKLNLGSFVQELEKKRKNLLLIIIKGILVI